MLNAYIFERDLLEKCKGRKLARVVTPLAHGNVQVPGWVGDLSTVYYIVFELARGDIRTEVANWKQFDLAWALRSLHHASIGLRQLHSVGIAHQDLKPSNVLVFPQEGAKIADLGRSSSQDTPSDMDKCQIPGDVTYAAPEQLYGWRLSPDFCLRYVADLYQLGNLLFFYLTGISSTAAMRTKLVRAVPGFSGMDFIHDLPYLQQAFSEVVSDLRAILPPLEDKIASEIVMIAQQLCEPDPRRRGDSNAPLSGRPQHDLQAYISRFDRLAKRAEWMLK